MKKNLYIRFGNIMTCNNILLDDNYRHRVFTGVQKFHDAGYFGERVKAASAERWDTSLYNPADLVFNPLNMKSSNGAKYHAVNTAATFFQVAPKTKLYMLYVLDGFYHNDGTYENKFLDYSFEIIEKKILQIYSVPLLEMEIINFIMIWENG